MNSWGSRERRGACLGRRVVCALLSSKSTVPAEWFRRGPTGDCLASGDWEKRLGKLHQDPPRPEDGIRDPLQGLRTRDQAERARGHKVENGENLNQVRDREGWADMEVAGGEAGRRLGRGSMGKNGLRFGLLSQTSPTVSLFAHGCMYSWALPTHLCS